MTFVMYAVLPFNAEITCDNIRTSTGQIECHSQAYKA